MSLDQLLVWTIGVSMGGLAVRLVASRNRRSGWLVVAALVLTVLALGLAFAPDLAGRLAAAAWVPLFLLPAMLFRAVHVAVARQRFTLAVRLARAAALLHPADGWREQPRVLTAFALFQRGREDEARVILEGLAASGTPAGHQALVNLLRLERRWPELRAFVEARGPETLTDPTTLAAYARALGETGDLGALVALVTAHTDRLERTDPDTLHLVRMFLAAATGRPDLVLTLFAGPLERYPAAVRDYWLARAFQAAGDDARAGTLLLGLLPSRDALVRGAAREALTRPAPRFVPAATPPALLAAVDALHVVTATDQQTPTLARPPAGRPVVTTALVAALFAVFFLEIPGGATDADNLRQMGAMLAPREALAGEWWRLLTANFLHFGALHLGLNVMGVWYFGRYLERVAGRARFLAVYLASGIGAMATFLAIAEATGGAQPQMVVGASASLMGLVGASAVALFLEFRARRSRAVRRELVSLAALLALQTVFDLTTPQVSFIGHSSGLLLGLLLGLALLRPSPAPSSPDLAVARR